MNTYVAVDWYSFSYDVGGSLWQRDLKPTYVLVRELLADKKTASVNAVRFLFTNSILANGRGLYPDSIQSELAGARLFYALEHATWLVELSGTGCAQLREAGLLQGLIDETYETCTRIDVAIDYIDGDVTVDQVIGGIDLSSSLTHARFISPTGETQYIGSMKSDRFCRIYCYAEPHPRAGVTRAEFVYRKPYSPKVAEHVKNDLAREVVAGAMKRLGIDVLYWPDATQPAEPKIRRKGALENAGTLRWVVTAVVPSLQKLIAEGVLTADELLGWLGCISAQNELD